MPTGYSWPRSDRGENNPALNTVKNFLLTRQSNYMEKFMLIVRADLEKLRKISEEERYADWPDMLGWVKALVDSGNRLEGAPLSVSGKLVSKNEVLSDALLLNPKKQSSVMM